MKLTADEMREWFVRVRNSGARVRDGDRGTSGYDFLEVAQWVAEADTALASVFPATHPIWNRWRATLKDTEGQLVARLAWSETVQNLRGIFATAVSLVDRGFLATVHETVRAETVAELLEQAEQYCTRGELVAGTVIAGGALETHLRHLCEGNGLEWSGAGSIAAYDQAIAQARKAGTVEVYNSGRSKDIIAWGDRRNRAAHTPGSFDEERRTIELMVEGIRGFVRETSAS